MPSAEARGAAPAHELILGGQRSGKSRCAELRALAWLAADPQRSATLIATARADDVEMRTRIERHRADRARAAPAMGTIEVPRELAAAIAEHSRPERLLVVDCLTLWLTQLLMPGDGGVPVDGNDLDAARTGLCRAVDTAPGPVLLVSNEIGLGVTPLGRETRRFVDEIGRLHQALAALCPRVTLMVAGIEWPVKPGRAEAAP